MALTRTLRLVSGRRSLIISGRAPTRAELTAARRAAHSLAALGRASVFHVPGADGNDNAGDRNHLVLATPNVIMNHIRLPICPAHLALTELSYRGRTPRSSSMGDAEATLWLHRA
jgi:hypothetical protein